MNFLDCGQAPLEVVQLSPMGKLSSTSPLLVVNYKGVNVYTRRRLTRPPTSTSAEGPARRSSPTLRWHPLCGLTGSTAGDSGIAVRRRRRRCVAGGRAARTPHTRAPRVGAAKTAAASAGAVGGSTAPHPHRRDGSLGVRPLHLPHLPPHSDSNPPCSLFDPPPPPSPQPFPCRSTAAWRLPSPPAAWRRPPAARGMAPRAAATPPAGRGCHCRRAGR